RSSGGISAGEHAVAGIQPIAAAATDVRIAAPAPAIAGDALVIGGGRKGPRASRELSQVGSVVGTVRAYGVVRRAREDFDVGGDEGLALTQRVAAGDIELVVQVALLRIWQKTCQPAPAALILLVAPIPAPLRLAVRG